jgi:Late competence development protein ComFB
MSIEQIHNYHERLVLDEVVNRVRDQPGVTEDMVADIACVALNRMPARYVRHDVDLVFYLTETERHQIEVNLDSAISYALMLVTSRSAQAEADAEAKAQADAQANSDGETGT